MGFCCNVAMSALGATRGIEAHNGDSGRSARRHTHRFFHLTHLRTSPLCRSDAEIGTIVIRGTRNQRTRGRRREDAPRVLSWMRRDNESRASRTRTTSPRSFLVRKGTDVTTVQKPLRHSDIATTLGIYAHSMSKDRLAAQGNMLAAMVTPSNGVN